MLEEIHVLQAEEGPTSAYKTLKREIQNAEGKSLYTHLSSIYRTKTIDQSFPKLPFWT